MFINEKREDCCNEILDFKIDKLKTSTYYVVEIKFRKNNPIHRCMMGTGFSKSYPNNEEKPEYCELYSNNYEGVEKKRIKDIYWFKVIKEIPEMKS